jgi:hypothetical protein
MMRLSRILFPALICCSVVIAGVAQDRPQFQDQAPPPPVSSQSPPPVQVTPAVQAREWVPQGVEAMGQNASSRTEFTLDHSMLVMASKLDRDNEDLRRVIAGVNGVSVHSFRFPGAVSFDPMVMDSIKRQYREAGWQHLVSNHKDDRGLATDLWIRLDHAAISDIAVLFVGVKQLNFVSVSGSITPLDLLHLSGHFGIPRMDGGAVVPVR